MKKRILTGDRPTGKLHLGHYVGSLKNRLDLQDKNEVFLLVADLHALTTNQDTKELRQNIKNLVLDQLSVGIDPEKVSFCVQSQIPEAQELFTIFSMLVSIKRLERIPTTMEVVRDLGIKNITLGLRAYPVLQAADIMMVRANLVPVGKDQASHLELTREIVKEFNRTYKEVFPIPEALIPKDVGSLPGIDGKAKMGKSLNNAIYLSDDKSVVKKKVMKMYTDPTRIHSTDPGHVKGNPVFIYLDAFAAGKDKSKVEDLKEKYEKGKVGDVQVKEFLTQVLNRFLDPIRDRRTKLEQEKGMVEKILGEGTKKARSRAVETLDLVKEAMNLQ
ncbi:tryptophan--tRNA ligase [Patescibacteria group bacterium]|nr:tryptophan--tRNA ligase [Patescibacteria group bacterium]